MIFSSVFFRGYTRVRYYWRPSQRIEEHRSVIMITICIHKKKVLFLIEDKNMEKKKEINICQMRVRERCWDKTDLRKIMNKKMKFEATATEVNNIELFVFCVYCCAAAVCRGPC